MTGPAGAQRPDGVGYPPLTFGSRPCLIHAMTRSPALQGARRHPSAIVIAMFWLLLAPVCEAICFHDAGAVGGASSTQPMLAVADCHGQRLVDPASPEAEAQAETRAEAECCGSQVLTNPGADRIDPPPPAVTEFRPQLVDQAVPAVRLSARNDPAAHSQGPPLRLLTLRFIE